MPPGGTAVGVACPSEARACSIPDVCTCLRLWLGHATRPRDPCPHRGHAAERRETNVGSVHMCSYDQWHSTLRFHWELVGQAARRSAIRRLTRAGRRTDPEQCLEEMCRALAHLQMGRPQTIRLLLNDHWAVSSTGRKSTPQQMARRLLAMLEELHADDGQ